MSVEEKLRVLSDRIKTHSSAMLTEEALKTAIGLPFLAALDYDVFNPDESYPNFVPTRSERRVRKSTMLSKSTEISEFSSNVSRLRQSLIGSILLSSTDTFQSPMPSSPFSQTVGRFTSTLT
jgi:ribosome-associated toxin RatA of RatAB toxin-antitoxin module